jgi:hypothetical protein
LLHQADWLLWLLHGNLGVTDYNNALKVVLTISFHLGLHTSTTCQSPKFCVGKTILIVVIFLR